MAVSGSVKLEVIAQAEENIRAVLKASNQAIKSTSRELENASDSQAKMGSVVDSVKAKVTSFKGAIVAMGAAAAVAGGKQLLELAKNGAAVADQLDAVKSRVANAEEIIAATREATSGVVDDAAIQKGIALFDAFGLELAALPGLMEQASKTSIRTGDSVNFLIQSAITGVSKLEPAILDNLGLQVRLSEATQVAADKFGKEAKAVTDTETKAGMLALVLKKLGTLNKDIDLNNSRVASIQRLEVEYKNLSDTISSRFVNVLLGANDAVSNISEVMNTELVNAARRAGDAINATVNEMSAAAKAAIKVDRALERIGLTARARAEEERAIVEETRRIEATVNREKAASMKQLKKDLADELDAIDAKIRNEKRFNAIRNKASAAMDRARDKAKEVAASRLAEEKETLEGIHARRDATLAELDAITGTAKNSREIREIQSEITALRKQSETAAKGEKAGIEDTINQRLELINTLTEEDKKSTKRRGTRKKVEKDITSEIAERIKAQVFANKLATTQSERDKVRLRFEERSRKINVEIAALGKATNKDDLKAAMIKGAELDRDQALADLRVEGETAAAASLRRAKEQLELTKASTDIEEIQIALKHELGEINRDALSLEEAKLNAKVAQANAEERIKEIQDDRREQLASDIANVVGGGFGEMSEMFSELDANLDALNRPKRYESIAKGFAGIAAQSQEIASSVGKFVSTVGKGNAEVASGVAASLGSLGPAVTGFVNGVTEKAVIMAAFETAMGIATLFSPTGESASHFVAAGMFAAMAGISASQPTGALPESTAAAAASAITPAADPQEMEAQRITVNLGPGMIMGLPQQLGRAISEQINSMSNTGMNNTAF